MATFFLEEQEKLKNDLETSEYWPLLDIYVEVDEIGIWVPARWEGWEKPVGSTEWMAEVIYVGYESDGLHAIELKCIRSLVVPDLEEGSKKVSDIHRLKTGTKVRAIYLADRCWYGAEVVQVFKRRDFVNVIFDDYNENQNTVLPLLAIVEDETMFRNSSEKMLDCTDEDGVVEEARGKSEEDKAQEYVRLVFSGVPLATVELAAANDELPSGLVRRRVEEAKRRGEGSNATGRQMILDELQKAQCLEDGFLRRVFDTYDTRKPPGQLTPLDFVDALKNASSALARNALELFVEFDGDEDGGLDFDEFKRGIRHLVATEDSDRMKSLVWFWRAQQEQWYTGTGNLAPPVEDVVKLRPMRRNSDTDSLSDMMIDMRRGGTPREIARPCLVRLEARQLTVWRLASSAEALRTRSTPPLSEAKYRGIVSESTVVVSAARRTALRCDLVLKLEGETEVRLWLPVEPRQRSRWITALDRCAAIGRAQALLSAQQGGSFSNPKTTGSGHLENTNDENDNNNEKGAEAFVNDLALLATNETETQVGELRIVIWAGRDLVARDHSVLSRVGSSDPYCRIYLDEEPELWRATRVVSKNLNPIWNQCFWLPVTQPPKTLVLVCADHDRSSRDDFMGSLRIPLAEKGGLLLDKQWLTLTPEIPNDKLTKQLADTHRGGSFSVKKPAEVSGQICISVSRCVTPSLFVFPESFKADENNILLVGAYGAKGLPTTFLKRTRNPRLVCRILGSNSDDSTSVRISTTSPIWAEVLAPAFTLGDTKINKIFVLECIVEDLDTSSGKAAPIAGIHIPLRADAPFTLRKSDYQLQDPSALSSSTHTTKKTPTKKNSTLDLAIHWRPPIDE